MGTTARKSRRHAHEYTVNASTGPVCVVVLAFVADR